MKTAISKSFTKTKSITKGKMDNNNYKGKVVYQMLKTTLSA